MLCQVAQYVAIEVAQTIRRRSACRVETTVDYSSFVKVVVVVVGVVAPLHFVIPSS